MYLVPTPSRLVYKVLSYIELMTTHLTPRKYELYLQKCTIRFDSKGVFNGTLYGEHNSDFLA